MDLDKLKNELLNSGEEDSDIKAALEYANNLSRLNMPVIFDANHFALLQGCSKQELSVMMIGLEKYYYHKLSIPKKNGFPRQLNVPSHSLKTIQKWILNNILYKIPVSEQAQGFCKNRSIVTNAEKHINKECIINLDLKDFFTTITRKQIYNVFYYYGYTEQISNILARLCTYDGYLPQGGVTSPYLSNIVCLKLDKRLNLLAQSYDATYSRYADDITFSGNKGVTKILSVANKIIEDEGFVVNSQKTRIQYKNRRQEVTGLIINGGKVHVNRNT